MTIIGNARFSDPRQGLTQASAVLNFLGLHAAIFDMAGDPRGPGAHHPPRGPPGGRARDRPRDPERRLRACAGAGAQAAAQVLDPAFGAALAYALPRERDVIAPRAHHRSARELPAQGDGHAADRPVRDDDRAVTTLAQRALVAISGEDFGPEASAWQLWWDQAGKSRWP